MNCMQKTGRFFAAHWRGVVVFVTPIFAYGVTLAAGSPVTPAGYCGMTIIIMAVFWMTEAIPLPVTGLIPMFLFPLLGVLDSTSVCQAYVSDTVMIFLGSLFLAYSIELSGLHTRLALLSVKAIGYSHIKLLFALSFVTMFVSMWITNTAATSMMLPINFAILKVFEDQGLMNVFTIEGDERIPSPIATCYFCSATYAATIGGIGTLVGTGTNLAFKGLFESTYPKEPGELSFPLFSAFTIPLMLACQTATYLWMAVFYLGFLRPGSKAAKSATLTKEGLQAAKNSVDVQYKKLGKMTFHEACVGILFTGAMVMFFSRSPGIFTGWADLLCDFTKVTRKKYIMDSPPCFFVVFLMLFLPSSLIVFKYCSAKYKDDLPLKPVASLLEWNKVYSMIPWSFALLLGGGFALSTAARKTGFSDKVGNSLQSLSSLPTEITILVIIIVTVVITNFASNVAVANIICPVAMSLATNIKVHPLWFNLAAGISASFCFMLPVGTPGNLIVQGATNMPSLKMVVAGSGVTLAVIILTWAFMISWIKVIWKVGTFPEWAAA